MKERKVIISGGGTGGHIYPALAVGRKLQEKDPSLRLTFVGTSRPVEKKIMDRHQVNFIPMKIEGLKGKGIMTIKSLVILPFSFLKAFRILLRLKPDLVIGVGGYSSGPIVLLASIFKMPTLILEQNVRPGFTNRLLLRWARKAVVSFASSLNNFKGKGLLLGNPVREEFYTLKPKARSSKLTLLIFGGSQGSRFLNQAVTVTLPLLHAEKEDLAFFHQTGKADFDGVKKSYSENGFEDAVVAPYFFDMANYFERADLVISRAGATTIAELIVSQKAAILFPFAKAAEGHQIWNARELEKVNGTEVILEEDFRPQLLAGRIRYYLRHQDQITAMEKNLAALKMDRPAEKIADLCFELMEA